MKTPRLTDFDPNAKMPVLASPLDGYPTITKPLKAEPTTPAVPVAPVEPKSIIVEPSGNTASKPYSNMASNQPRNHDTMQPRYRDTTATEPVEAIRKGVRELGEKAATHRFTHEEKEVLADIEYTYRKQYGWQTSENELTRIAIRWLIEDYRSNGENSLLHKVLKVLKS